MSDASHQPGGPHHPGHAAPLSEGDKVLLLDRKQRRYLITLKADGQWHSHHGFVPHTDLIGLPEGSAVRTTKGSTLLVFRPTAADWTVKAPRGAQVVYPKDQAMIVSLADVCPGATVVEAGAGSGALTSALLRAVGPAGRVISFELRDEHADIAERNVAERFGGAPANWELRRGDVVAGLAEVDCDRVILDLAEPWTVLKVAAEALHPGGILLGYTPSVVQVMRLREALDADARWGLAATSETLVRTWHVDGQAVRPDHRMVAHTAFLTTARRLADTAL
ncbi:MAG TPA: tRNA (adenine-N1)-methyltransferase [Egibacteraceae bacterium]|nr:tRNA (adenine-N1)-methyltransferase [Egibacteraceae bacterium]